MTNGQIALLLEALEQCKLDEHFAGFLGTPPLTDAQKAHVMLYIESWIEPKLRTAIRLGLGIGDTLDKHEARSAGSLRTRDGLEETYNRIACDHYARRKAQREQS